MTESHLSPAVITVGEELVWGELANGNQQWMLQWLKEQDQPAGIAITLPDHQDTIAKWLMELHKEFHPLIVSGGIGGTHFTPIINPPEVAILGVGRTFDRLVKEKNQIVSKKILPISLSYDHRLIDGAEGARFCVYLGKCLGKDFAFKLAV